MNIGIEVADLLTQRINRPSIQLHLDPLAIHHLGHVRQMSGMGEHRLAKNTNSPPHHRTHPVKAALFEMARRCGSRASA